jgi:hypothetical protein
MKIKRLFPTFHLSENHTKNKGLLILLTTLILVSIGVFVKGCCEEISEHSIENSNNGWEFYNLKGPVKSFLEKWYDHSSGMPSKAFWITTVDFDKKGNKIRSEASNQSSFRGHSEYKINGKNQCTERVSYDEFGSANSKSIYCYNENGDQVEELSYRIDPNSKLILERKWLSEFNDSHQKIRVKTLNPQDSVEMETESLYDKNNYEIAQITHYRGSTTSMLFENDTEGNCIRLNTGTSIIESKYEFDNKGNWIIKRVYIDGDLNRIEERTITYW